MSDVITDSGTLYSLRLIINRFTKVVFIDHMYVTDALYPSCSCHERGEKGEFGEGMTVHSTVH